MRGWFHRRRPRRSPPPPLNLQLRSGHRPRYGEWIPGAPGVYKPAAPLLILTGENDDWTPAEPCRQLAERSRAAGLPVAIKVYPDAHHAFDNASATRFVEARVNANSPTGRGATTGGSAAAWADSIGEVKSFFAKHLSR